MFTSMLSLLWCGRPVRLPVKQVLRKAEMETLDCWGGLIVFRARQ